MKRLAIALFESIDGGIDSFSRELASKVRTLVGAERLTVEQHKELERLARDGMESVVWHALGRLNNVGCSLPDDVLGYRLLGIPATAEGDDRDIEIEEPAGEDISDGFTDYSDLWLEYVREKRNSGTVPK